MLAYVLNTSFKPSICLPSCTASFQLACVLLQLAFVLPSSGHRTVPQGQNTMAVKGPRPAAHTAKRCFLNWLQLASNLQFKPSIAFLLPASNVLRARLAACNCFFFFFDLHHLLLLLFPCLLLSRAACSLSFFLLPLASCFFLSIVSSSSSSSVSSFLLCRLIAFSFSIF